MCFCLFGVGRLGLLLGKVEGICEGFRRKSSLKLVDGKDPRPSMNWQRFKFLGSAWRLFCIV
jgi:hypothetical protein